MGQNPVSVINSQFYPILIFDFPLYYNSLVMPVKYLHFSSGLHLWIQLKGNFSIIVYDFMKNLKHARTSHCVKRFEFGGWWDGGFTCCITSKLNLLPSVMFRSKQLLSLTFID